MNIQVRNRLRGAAAFALGAVVALGPGLAVPISQSGVLVPLVAEFEYLSGSETPPSQGACNAVRRRCFNPASIANSYNYAVLHKTDFTGTTGKGTTIALIDSFGSDTIANDLHVFNTAFGLPNLCGEAKYVCKAGDSTFKQLSVQGSHATTPPPTNNGTGLENHNLWALEVSLDVEWAHATAPGANILLVTTPTAETLGVQGFPQMMNAVQYVIDNHLADVISMSLGAGEGTFNDGFAALQNLRKPFVDARDNRVTLLASTGDSGTANAMKEPVKNPGLIPYPSVIWPASDPLVTAVGGTYLCTDANSGLSVDNTSPPANCRVTPSQREIGWVAGGGGYSILFQRPAYQNVLPPGSSFAGTSAGAPGPNSNMRGIPDIAYQASSRTGVLVYMTLSPTDRATGTSCSGANPCSPGWYVVGGTSSGAPQWAGIVAMGDQMAGRKLGFINPGLYQVAANPAKYAADYFDVTRGNNQQAASIPGYAASPGWDAVTGLGTPNVAKLLPDLIAATP